MKNWSREFVAKNADRLWDYGVRYLEDTGRELADYRGVLFLGCVESLREYDLYTGPGQVCAGRLIRSLIQEADLDDTGLRAPFDEDGCMIQMSPEAWANLTEDEARAGLRCLQGD